MTRQPLRFDVLDHCANDHNALDDLALRRAGLVASKLKLALDCYDLITGTTGTFVAVIESVEREQAQLVSAVVTASI